MRYKDHSHLESLTCHVTENSMRGGEPLTPYYFADLVLRYEQDENVKFTDGEILQALRDGTETWVDSMQENAQDTVGEKERDQAWADEQIAYYEKYRPSVIRRQQVMALVEPPPRGSFIDLLQKWSQTQSRLHQGIVRYTNDHLEALEDTVQELLKLLTTQYHD